MPLGSESHQFSEAGVEAGSGRRVDASVWSQEDGFAVSVVFDLPSVLMEKPVVITTEEDQIVQIGRSAINPMCDVMGVEPTSLWGHPGHTNNPRPDATVDDVASPGSAGSA